ncbi:hypothetical protein ABIE27_004707 [Paenibacillus sp. 4624]
MSSDDIKSLWAFVKRISLIAAINVILIVIIKLLDRSGSSFLYGFLTYLSLESYFYWRTKIVANKIR